eukprot:Hpha_TRINITY_DN8956_c0_g1::TRINITY_DN8956_c0_g1_i1::g.80792::m.80792/K01093/appA; 4-phytase / acid phosphatase
MSPRIILPVVLLGSLLLCLWVVAEAPKTGGGDGVILTLHISRHSIKAPGVPQLANYTSFPFNASGFGGVKPGLITPHGERFGAAAAAYYRALYSGTGGPIEGGCASAGNFFVYSDPEERDMETARLLVNGMMPGCEPTVCCGDDLDLTNALFTEGEDARLPPGCGRAGEADALAIVGGDPQKYNLNHSSGQLQRLSEVTNCCKPSECPVGVEDCSLLGVPDHWVGGYYKTFVGGWSVAASMASLWFTRYVEGLPSPVKDAREAEWLLSGTADSLYDVYRSAANAARFGNDFVAHVAASLLAAAGQSQPSVPGSILRHSAGTQLLWYVGHDMQMAWLRDTLPLGGWREGQPYPFLSSVVLQLHSKGTSYYVSAFLDAADPDSIRTLGSSGAPLFQRTQLSLPGECGDSASCELGIFVKALLRKADATCALPGLQEFIETRQ